jgi:hypothetical protein
MSERYTDGGGSLKPKRRLGDGRLDAIRATSDELGFLLSKRGFRA